MIPRYESIILIAIPLIIYVLGPVDDVHLSNAKNPTLLLHGVWSRLPYLSTYLDYQVAKNQTCSEAHPAPVVQ